MLAIRPAEELSLIGGITHALGEITNHACDGPAKVRPAPVPTMPW
jgi:hypothetical protein